MFKRHDDGTYSFSTRFWVYSTIATVIICWIGWRTQDTANKVEAQAAATALFANDTNNCLVDVVSVLTTRVGYNDAIAALDQRRQEIDARRQQIWDKLVDDLAASNNSDGLNMAALAHFREANAKLKADQAKLAADQATLVERRDSNQYPECPSTLDKSPGK